MNWLHTEYSRSHASSGDLLHTRARERLHRGGHQDGGPDPPVRGGNRRRSSLPYWPRGLSSSITPHPPPPFLPCFPHSLSSFLSLFFLSFFLHSLHLFCFPPDFCIFLFFFLLPPTLPYSILPSLLPCLPPPLPSQLCASGTRKLRSVARGFNERWTTSARRWETSSASRSTPPCLQPSSRGSSSQLRPPSPTEPWAARWWCRPTSQRPPSPSTGWCLSSTLASPNRR